MIAVWLMISETLGACGSCFADDFQVPKGCLRCRIHASAVVAVWLMISKSLEAFCAIESIRQ